MSDDTYDSDKNYILAANERDDALQELLWPTEIIVVITLYQDGRSVYRTFDDEDRAMFFVERMSDQYDVESVSYAFTFLNYTEQETEAGLFTVH